MQVVTGREPNFTADAKLMLSEQITPAQIAAALRRAYEQGKADATHAQLFCPDPAPRVDDYQLASNGESLVVLLVITGLASDTEAALTAISQGNVEIESDEFGVCTIRNPIYWVDRESTLTAAPFLLRCKGAGAIKVRWADAQAGAAHKQDPKAEGSNTGGTAWFKSCGLTSAYRIEKDPTQFWPDVIFVETRDGMQKPYAPAEDGCWITKDAPAFHSHSDLFKYLWAAARVHGGVLHVPAGLMEKAKNAKLRIEASNMRPGAFVIIARADGESV
jgi:hypothetical protein